MYVWKKLVANQKQLISTADKPIKYNTWINFSKAEIAPRANLPQEWSEKESTGIHSRFYK